MSRGSGDQLSQVGPLLRELRPNPVGLMGSLVLGGAVLGFPLLLGQPLPVWVPVAVVILVAIGLFLPGLANQVTLSRAYLAAPALIASLHVETYGWLAALVVLAALTDVSDGAIARATSRTSVLGAALDPVVDGLFYGAVGAGLALGGTVPVWLGALVVARYAIPALVGAALLRGRVIGDLRHTPMGRLSTTLVALVLGGCALFRFLHLSTAILLSIGLVLIPLATLATFINLALVGQRLGRQDASNR